VAVDVPSCTQQQPGRNKVNGNKKQRSEETEAEEEDRDPTVDEGEMMAAPVDC
jgi:hypothetical protein